MFQAWLLVSPSSFWNVVVSAGSFLPACLLPRLECCSSLVGTVSDLGVTLEGLSARVVSGSEHPCVLLPQVPPWAP